MKAIVKEHASYGPGGVHPAGTVLEVSQSELDAFGDKLLFLEPSGENWTATAAAVELAEDHGVDLATVSGTGAGGRITVSDVRDEVNALTVED